MSKYSNYSQSKLLLFFSGQYARDIYKSSVNIDKFIGSGTNGFVLIPQYDIRDVPDNQNATAIVEMVNFIKLIYQSDNECNLWLGLPQISSSTINYYNNNGGIYTQYNKMKNYVNNIRSKIISENPNIWDNCVKGYYYNQESIYCTTFNYNNYMSNDEVKLMNDLSYHIHNLKNSNNDNDTRDLIWIPYFPTKNAGNLTEAEIIKRLGHVIGGTTCFDCAYIQAGYITAIQETYKQILNATNWDPERTDYDNFVPNENAISIASTLFQRITNSKKNFESIMYTLSQNTFTESKQIYYRDLVPVDVNIGNYATCIVGAEFEYSTSVMEHQGIKVIIEKCLRAGGYNEYTYNESNYFQDNYSLSYQQYVDKKPMALYFSTWDNKIDDCIQAIKSVYNTNDRAVSNSFNNSYIKYNDALASYSKSIYNTVLNNFSTPSTSYFYMFFANNTMNKYKLHTSIAMVNTALKYDAPNAFWIANLGYSIVGGNTNNITQIKVSRFSKYNNTTTNNKYAVFTSDFNDVIAVINNSLININDDINKFIVIHDWLIYNVSYSTNLTNTDYSCAFGAISNDISTANSMGFALTLSLLCNYYDIPCITVEGTKNGINHAWNYVKLSGEWRFVDASLNVPTASDHYQYKYFLRDKPDTYIEKNSFPLPNISHSNFIKYGDVDLDGYITAADAACAQQYVLTPSSYPLTPLKRIAADVTGDGSVGSDDVSHIMQKVLVSTYTLPVESKIATYL